MPENNEGAATEEPAFVEIYQKFLDDAVLLIRDRVIINCNDITLDLYGYTKDPLIHQQITLLVALEFHDPPPWTSTTDKTGILQAVCRRAKGTVFPAKISVKTGL